MAESESKVLDSLKNIFSVPELRNRIFFMLAMLAVYRVGSWIPTPGIDATALEQFFSQQAGGSLMGFLDLFTGGNLRRFSIFAQGIMPYITASIILQLMTIVWPYLEKLSKEGELGRKKITQYTRYLTIALSIFQSLATAFVLEQTSISASQPIVLHPGLGFKLLTVITLTTGTAFIMWLGEQITERGIGNGISLIIFAGIVAGLPSGIAWMYRQVTEGSLMIVLALIVVMILVVAFVVFVERGQRKIPIQYAKRMVGRKVYGGQSTYLPLRVNAGGVIPIIFASSLLALPQTLKFMIKTSWMENLSTLMSHGYPLYILMYALGILFFTFFYVGIIYNPNEVADNIRKFGGSIPGIRPGKPTAELIDKVMTRLTFAAGVYLVLVSLLPDFLISGVHLASLPWVGDWLHDHMPQFVTQGLGVTFYFGGTSLLIVVGVAMDTVNQIESQLIMRHYDGFLKRGRIRGRRS
jgi:preprotein translocase subunit SecY